ncbi:MAG: thiamine pyrophosphate-requiring protein [Alphaproteobacteria bacterium]|jgi:acetolactate synthase-1/2/3 large subunit
MPDTTITTAMPRTAAEAFLLSLKQSGIDYFFANPGTDFAPIIEAYSYGQTQGWDLPEPLPITHETVAMGMAYGYTMVTGKPQAVMLHTNVGLANGIMGLLNAASDQIPMLLISGRTPLTETGRDGRRDAGIHWGQEMRDQAGMIREATKWDYDARFGDQIPSLLDRALAIAESAPQGPVYLSLAREVLGEAWPKGMPLPGRRLAPASATRPSAQATEQAASMLAEAKRPIILAQRSGTDARAWNALVALAERFALPVGEHWTIRPSFPTAHPMHAGFAPSAALAEADVVVVLDSMVPWIPAHTELAPDCKVIQMGADPLVSKLPVRGYPSDLTLAGDVALTLEDLHAAMEDLIGAGDQRLTDRRDSLAAAHHKAREAVMAIAKAGSGSSMHPFYATLCINEAFGADATYVSELALNPAVMDIQRPGQYLSHAMSGGLGWGIPAALGVQLAKPGEQVVAAVGDGSHLFANPVACHQVAEAFNLPILACVFNNGIWNAVRRAALNMYPDGDAAKANIMPLTSLRPLPDFASIAKASRAHGEQVLEGQDLPKALERAKAAIKSGQPALLDVAVRLP